MDNPFIQVVQRIFSNWTALQLAVEHHMAGIKSQECAVEFANYIANYCTSNCSSLDLQEVIEDVLDEEFDTICEDESPKEVAIVLDRFIRLWNEKNLVQFETEFNNLPPIKDWLFRPIVINEEEESSSSEDEMPEVTAEEVDPGWTQVKSRRKR